MPAHSHPLVGQKFRPPATALLSILPDHTACWLQAEPTNQHDPNAIQVWLAGCTIPDAAQEELEARLAGLYQEPPSFEQVREEIWHIGYIKATDAAELKAGGLWFDREASLAFGPKGGVRVEWDD